MWWLMVSTALAQGLTLQEGDSVLADCLLDEGCGAFWSTQMAETLLEVGFAFDHGPIATSALGNKGNGLVAELHVDSIPLGERNDLGQRWTPPPVVPRIGLGYQIGSYTYDDPYPQYALGVHVLPPLQMFGGTVFSAGGTASAAVPVQRWLWLGGEVDTTWSSIRVPLLQSTDSLKSVEELADFLGKGVECEDGCDDSITQLGSGARLGLSLEPIPAVFAWGRLGAALSLANLGLDVDDTHWRTVGVLPTAGAGAGVRMGDRYQLAGGFTSALKPPAATTTRRSMVKVLVSMSFRFGAERYWDSAEPPEPGATDEPQPR